MSWSEQVFRYCERGSDPAFWAEPINALSNVAFLIVAWLAAARLAKKRAVARDGMGGAVDPMLTLLVALVVAIGIGSFLFHTLATRWARFADVAPIGLFMAVYLAFAVRRWLGWSWPGVVAAMLGFAVLNGLVAVLACPRRALDIVAYAREPCLNSTMAYLPALATLLVVGALLRNRHPAGRGLSIAAGVFLAAIVVRSLDRNACASLVLLGQPRGTHALWHLLVALAVHVLISTAMASQAPGPTLLQERRGSRVSP